jgi:hypothetical protein
MPPNGPQFSVDTHIFRELGELLVGRDSTALLELIKNSYDADASEITVTAAELDYPDRARIVIQDNGCGMTAGQFTNGFLRIASRLKDEGERRSRRYLRRYTGSKGIGRLAAHKLARAMEIMSVSGTPGGKSRRAIEARIDWERIESRETLAEVLDGISFLESDLPRAAAVGTAITLNKLRRVWSPAERARFAAECRACQVPQILTAPLPRRILDRPLLFETPTVRDVAGDDPGFTIRLEGDFAEGDDYWDALTDETGWVLEVVAARGEPEVRYAVAPTKATRQEFPETRPREFRHPIPFRTRGRSSRPASSCGMSRSVERPSQDGPARPVGSGSIWKVSGCCRTGSQTTTGCGLTPTRSAGVGNRPRAPTRCSRVKLTDRPNGSSTLPPTPPTPEPCS